MVQRGNESKPSVRALSRREFVSLTAAAGGAVLAGGAPAGAARRAGETATTPPRRFTLPPAPSQNPAFMARAEGDGLLAWSVGAGGALQGYRLNGSGRALWRLCDGTRDVAAIGAEYARSTGRPAEQGAAFVRTLLELGVVVAGATIVPAEFPTPPPGGCYHRRIEPSDPVSG